MVASDYQNPQCVHGLEIYLKDRIFVGRLNLQHLVHCITAQLGAAREIYQNDRFFVGRPQRLLHFTTANRPESGRVASLRGSTPL